MTGIGFNSHEYEDVSFLKDGQGAPVAGPTVLMASGQTSAISPNTVHPPGTVLVKKTGDGKFYLGTDTTNGDAPAAASINTLITNPGAGGWDGDLVIKGHWGTLTVALSGDNTDAAVAAAIIAAAAAVNPEYSPITAADATGSVSITNKDTGKGTYLHAVHATVTTMLGASGADARGTDPEVVVTKDFADLLDRQGTAQDAQVPTYSKGRFLLAGLSGYTAETLAVLERGGSEIL